MQWDGIAQGGMTVGELVASIQVPERDPEPMLARGSSRTRIWGLGAETLCSPRPSLC